jgi:hypothetical protein
MQRTTIGEATLANGSRVGNMSMDGCSVVGGGRSSE